MTPFRKLLMQAMKEFARKGYRSEAELHEWVMRLHAALDAEMPNDDDSKRELWRTFEVIYDRQIKRGGISRLVPGVSQYTIDRVAPELRAELDRLVFASVDLIKLNKRAATEKTLQRFVGWVSSVPRGGSSETDIRSVAEDIVKSVAQVKYEARRVAIDQGHKLNAAVAHVVAHAEGAIAAIWHDRGEHEKNYDARKEHLARSGKVFLIRDSWAMQDGLIKKAGLQCTDEIEEPAQLPFCSCTYEYLTSLRDLPAACLTKKGKAALDSD